MCTIKVCFKDVTGTEGLPLLSTHRYSPNKPHQEIWMSHTINSVNCCFTNWPSPSECLTSKQNYIPEYADTHTIKSSYEDMGQWGIWICILIINWSFDSLPENKLERGLGNLNSCFIKRTREENEVSFGIREKFPVLFHDLSSKCCRHIPL